MHIMIGPTSRCPRANQLFSQLLLPSELWHVEVQECRSESPRLPTPTRSGPVNDNSGGGPLSHAERIKRFRDTKVN